MKNSNDHVHAHNTHHITLKLKAQIARFPELAAQDAKAANRYAGQLYRPHNESAVVMHSKGLKDFCAHAGREDFAAVYIENVFLHIDAVAALYPSAAKLIIGHMSDLMGEFRFIHNRHHGKRPEQDRDLRTIFIEEGTSAFPALTDPHTLYHLSAALILQINNRSSYNAVYQAVSHELGGDLSLRPARCDHSLEAMLQMAERRLITKAKTSSDAKSYHTPEL